MKYKKEPRSKNVQLDRSMYRNPSSARAKESRQGATESTGILKSDRLYNSPEYKKALNSIAVEYNKKIGSGKGNRVVKK